MHLYVSTVPEAHESIVDYWLASSRSGRERILNKRTFGQDISRALLRFVANVRETGEPKRDQFEVHPFCRLRTEPRRREQSSRSALRSARARSALIPELDAPVTNSWRHANQTMLFVWRLASHCSAVELLRRVSRADI